MADNTTLNPGAAGDTIATDDIGGVKHQLVKVEWGVADTATPVSTANPLPVDQTNTSVADGGTLPAKGVQIGGTDGSVFQVMSTDSAGRPNVNINGTVPVSGPLTDTQLRATAVPVSGTVTASGPLTDTQLRATPVPVSGTVTASGPLTDTQLRASAVPVDTELPAAGALADTASNPTTSVIGAFLQCFNGTSWDRVRGDTTNGIFANVKTSALPTGAATAAKQPALGTAGSASADVLSVQGIASMTPMKTDGSGFTQPVSGTVTANLGTAAVTNAGTFAVQDSQVIADDAAFTVATSKVFAAGFLADETATDSVDEGDAGAARMTLDRKLIVTVEPHTAGGWDTKNCTSGDGSTALTSTAQAIKASAGKLGGWFIYNPNATAAYVPIYNVASGSVTVGTTNPLMVLTIPATSAANLEMVNGVTFDTAIAAAAATTAAGNTAPSTALEANFFFK